MEKGDKKVIRAWTFYDWANSVYALVITTAIFPIFYTSVTTDEQMPVGQQDLVDFFGMSLKNSELYSYVASASFLIVSILSPILSGIADYSGKKKSFLQFFCYLGAASCASLFFFDVEHLEISMVPVLTASVGFWGSIVFYNAYLPEIAHKGEHDRVSARGFSMGYFGSSLLLILCLSLIMGIGDHLTKWCFILTGIWWAGFAQITYARLPHNPYHRKPSGGIIWHGLKELKKVFFEMLSTKRLKRYLTAFFIYSMGVQTVMLMAVIFAAKEIDWSDDGTTGLIISVLIIQFIAIPGAFLFSNMSKRIGNVNVLKIAVVIWVGVCITAYFIHTPVEFYILAGIVGFVMGGIQALSRSTYSKFLPETIDHASYFSFYDVLEKLGIVIGTFFFGFIEGQTGDMRLSVLLVMSFFFVGLILLFFVPKQETWSKDA